MIVLQNYAPDLPDIMRIEYCNPVGKIAKKQSEGVRLC